MLKKSTFLILLLALSCTISLLPGCGQSGALYLPEKTPAAAITTPPQPQQEPTASSNCSYCTHKN